MIGWFFEATVLQPFDYGRYPLEHKTVSIRHGLASPRRPAYGSTAAAPESNDHADTGPNGLLAYLVIFPVTADAFLSAARRPVSMRIFGAGDALHLKLASWPVVLGAAALLTHLSR